MNNGVELKELKQVNEKLKTFHKELDDQVNKLLQEHKTLKEGLFAFLEIEESNAQTLIEASEDHEIVRDKLETMTGDSLDIWDEYNKQRGKAELIILLKKEIEAVFKVAAADDSVDSHFEAKNEN